MESELSSTAWKRHVATEKLLREVGGLGGGQGFHPSLEIFQRQAQAVARLQELLVPDGQDNEYQEHQVGVFAREIGKGGVRNFMVDTFAGFALNNAPVFNPSVFIPWQAEQSAQPSKASELSQQSRTSLCHQQSRGSRPTQQSMASINHPGTLDHLYEVLLEDRPCWLYFDLEYSTEHNPNLDPELAMDAFSKTLAAFCSDILATELDLEGLIELDSSTSSKFSKHVLVPRVGKDKSR